MTDQLPAADLTAPQAATPQPKNTLALVALILAIVGFVFACMPGALIVGWILLPIAFLLGLVATFQKGKKGKAIAAILLSIVGTIVGVVVFMGVVAKAADDAFGGGEASVTEPGDAESGEGEATKDDEAKEDAPAAAIGTRENPAALGSEIAADDWKVTINSVTLGAGEQILAANMLNEVADEGSEYILVNYTVTYIGDDADGQMPAFVGLEYVTAAGNTVDATAKLVVAPDAMDTMSTLYSGASATGNTVIQVPSPVDGVIAVRAGMLADKVFVATK